MGRYVIRRVLQMVPVFFGTTLIVYWLMFASSGDPIQALAGERPVSPAQRAVLEAKFNLSDPFFVQYGKYMAKLLTGDLGETLTGRSISDLLLSAWPITIKLTLIAFAFEASIGLVAGLIAGIRRGGFLDTLVLVTTLIVISIPIFVIGSTLQYLLGVRWGLFPPTVVGDESLYAYLLPGFVLGSISLAFVARLTRTAIAENKRTDYERTARAKGLTSGRVIGIHVLRNSLIPVITFLGADLGTLMGGAIVTEGIFNVPGVGFQLFQAIRIEEGPTVVAFVSVLVVVYLLANLLVDVLYAVLDPRIRYE